VVRPGIRAGQDIHRASPLTRLRRVCLTGHDGGIRGGDAGRAGPPTDPNRAAPDAQPLGGAAASTSYRLVALGNSSPTPRRPGHGSSSGANDGSRWHYFGRPGGASRATSTGPQRGRHRGCPRVVCEKQRLTATRRGRMNEQSQWRRNVADRLLIRLPGVRGRRQRCPGVTAATHHRQWNGPLGWWGPNWSSAKDVTAYAPQTSDGRTTGAYRRQRRGCGSWGEEDPLPPFPPVPGERRRASARRRATRSRDEGGR